MIDGAPVPTQRLKTRADFLRAAKGRKARGALFTVQGFERAPDNGGCARVGFTVTKKVGGAVERNRIKRRLREIVRVIPDLGMRPSHDYVIVARREVLSVPFSSLATGLRAALRHVHGASAAKRPVGVETGAHV